MQDTKTIQNAKPVKNLIDFVLQKKLSITKDRKKKNVETSQKNVENSKRCECGRYFGLDGGTMRKSKTRQSGYICQVCFEQEKTRGGVK